MRKTALVLVGAAVIAFIASRPRIRAQAIKHLGTGRQALFTAFGPIRHIRFGLSRKAA